MFSLNQKMSEGMALVANIPPSSQAAGTQASPWVSLGNVLQLLAMIDVGAFGASATVDANIQQAQDGVGTGAKAITGKAIVQMLAAGGNNKVALINMRNQDLDTNNGYNWVQLNIIVGVAATQTAGKIFVNERFADESAFNIAGVAQII